MHGPPPPAALPTIFAALCLAVSLAACGDDGSPAEPVDAPSSVSAPPASEPEPTPPPEPTAPPEPTEEPAVPAGLDECLVGRFVLDSDAWVEGLAGVLRGSGLDRVEVDDEGEIAFELRGDGTYELIATDSRTVSTGSSPGGDVRWVMEFDGSEAGTWATSASGDELTLTAGSEGRLAADNQISIDGNPLPADQLPVSGTPWSDALRVTCDQDRVTAAPTDDPNAPEVVLRRVG